MVPTKSLLVRVAIAALCSYLLVRQGSAQGQSGTSPAPGRGGRHPGTGGGPGPGLLTTAGKVLFGGDMGGNLVAYDPANGKPLGHTHLGQISNALETYIWMASSISWWPPKTRYIRSLSTKL